MLLHPHKAATLQLLVFALLLRWAVVPWGPVGRQWRRLLQQLPRTPLAKSVVCQRVPTIDSPGVHPLGLCVHKNWLSHFGNLAPCLMTHAADDRSSRKSKMHPEMVHTILVPVDLLLRQWATAHLSLREIRSSGGFLAYFSRSFVHLPPLGL